MRSLTFHGLALLVFTFALCGCEGSQTAENSEAESDPHSHEIASINAAVSELKGYRDQIKAAFEAGKPGDCDGALHEAVHVLGALPESEPVKKLSEEDQAAVKGAIDELFAALNTIHDGFHDSTEIEGNVYDTVAEKIDTAIETIASKSPIHGPAAP